MIMSSRHVLFMIFLVALSLMSTPALGSCASYRRRQLVTAGGRIYLTDAEKCVSTLQTASGEDAADICITLDDDNDYFAIVLKARTGWEFKQRRGGARYRGRAWLALDSTDSFPKEIKRWRKPRKPWSLFPYQTDETDDATLSKVRIPSKRLLRNLDCSVDTFQARHLYLSVTARMTKDGQTQRVLTKDTIASVALGCECYTTTHSLEDGTVIEQLCPRANPWTGNAHPDFETCEFFYHYAKQNSTEWSCANECTSQSCTADDEGEDCLFCKTAPLGTDPAEPPGCCASSRKATYANLVQPTANYLAQPGILDSASSQYGYAKQDHSFPDPSNGQTFAGGNVSTNAFVVMGQAGDTTTGPLYCSVTGDESSVFVCGGWSIAYNKPKGLISTCGATFQAQYPSLRNTTENLQGWTEVKVWSSLEGKWTTIEETIGNNQAIVPALLVTKLDVVGPFTPDDATEDFFNPKNVMPYYPADAESFLNPFAQQPVLPVPSLSFDSRTMVWRSSSSTESVGYIADCFRGQTTRNPIIALNGKQIPDSVSSTQSFWLPPKFQWSGCSAEETCDWTTEGRDFFCHSADGEVTDIPCTITNTPILQNPLYVIRVGINFGLGAAGTDYWMGDALDEQQQDQFGTSLPFAIVPGTTASSTANISATVALGAVCTVLFLALAVMGRRNRQYRSQIVQMRNKEQASSVTLPGNKTSSLTELTAAIAADATETSVSGSSTNLV